MECALQDALPEDVLSGGSLGTPETLNLLGRHLPLRQVYPGPVLLRGPRGVQSPELNFWVRFFPRGQIQVTCLMYVVHSTCHFGEKSKRTKHQPLGLRAIFSLNWIFEIYFVCLSIYLSIFETGSGYVAQASLQLLILPGLG
jgi:hypothetical protein